MTESNVPDPLRTLRPRFVLPTWGLPKVAQPHWLIRAAGPDLDEIAGGFVRSAESLGDGVEVARVRGMRAESGAAWPIRVVTTFQPGHRVVTDVCMSRTGSDLHVRTSGFGNTRLVYYRLFLLGGAYLVLLALLVGSYLMLTGARNAWAVDYANARVGTEFVDWVDAPQKQAFLREIIDSGYREIDLERAARIIEKTPGLAEALRAELRNGTLSLEATLRTYESMQSVTMDSAPFPPHFLEVLFDEILPGFHEDGFIEFRAGTRYRFDGSAVNRLSKILLRPEYAERLQAGVASIRTANPEVRDRLVEALEVTTRDGPPMSLWDLFRADPRNALLNFGMPASLMAAALGFFLWKSPRTAISPPCRLLGAPTPDEFDARAAAATASVLAQVGEAFAARGISREQLIDLGSGA